MPPHSTGSAGRAEQCIPPASTNQRHSLLVTASDMSQCCVPSRRCCMYICTLLRTSFVKFDMPASELSRPPSLCACLQALSLDEEDAYTHSSWANSKSLKQAFAGINSVRIPR
eukprot:GHRQ01039185.1.p2 GENE.GHRQ01039185.1~~GHRQ01039185.1.p2  ORF type:complete len:113 (+),score=13.41 GHRQ01039185.1:314-652(+)